MREDTIRSVFSPDRPTGCSPFLYRSRGNVEIKQLKLSARVEPIQNRNHQYFEYFEYWNEDDRGMPDCALHSDHI